MKTIVKNRKGMTLVELLIAGTVMGVVAMAISTLYISTQRTSTSQIELVDVQANLRLALDQITDDIRMAGFLVDADPIKKDASTATLMTIQTAPLGSRYARVSGEVTTTGPLHDLPVASEVMAGGFSGGDKVRIIRPPMLSEPDAKIFTVQSIDPTPGSASIKLSDLTSGVTFQPGDIIVGTRSGAPLINQIVYSRNTEKALVRSVNGADQLLARNVSFLDFQYQTNEDGLIHTVEVKIEGETDTPEGTKTRALETQVTVRNL